MSNSENMKQHEADNIGENLLDNVLDIDIDPLAQNSRKIWPTPGGVHPPEHKEQSLQLPLAELDIPAELIYPLSQHVGTPAKPIVEVGDRVLTGQLIASAEQNISANIHAASSGTVKNIEPRPLPHPSGLSGSSIVIETDGKDEWVQLEVCDDYRKRPPIELLEKIKQAGVVGMGGAGFPTAVKLSPNFNVDTLILNGTECEPYITADDMLMRTQADNIVAGAMMLSYILGEPQDILLAIEANKPQAIATMRQAVANSSTAKNRIDVVALPTKYPSGGEKQLIQMLTGREVPSGRLPAHVGAVCQNIASAVAAYRAVTLGEPLIARITTITGNAFEAQRNVTVRLGTPIHHILRTQGYDAEKASRLVMGGPMMGFTLLSDRAPIIKTTNCILAPANEESPPPQPAQACIRCGLCAEACPATLLPQQLYWYARAQEFEKLKSHHLFDCIECGACSYACPSHIPLVQYYRAAKGEIKLHEQEKIDSDRSRQRFEFHKDRIENEKQERIRAREEAAAKAKERKEAKALAAKQKSIADESTEPDHGDTNTTPKPSEDNSQQQAKLERGLISNQDKLVSLQEQLADAEKHSPQKSDSFRAKIKGVELKISNLQQKIKDLNTNNTADIEILATPKSTTAETPPVEAIPSKSHAVIQLEQKLDDTRGKLQEAQEQGDIETVTALNMSLNILQDRLQTALENDRPTSEHNTLKVEEHQTVKSAIERAVEKVLDDREKSEANSLQEQIETLQQHLQSAKDQISSSNNSSVSELSQVVAELESKLTTAIGTSNDEDEPEKK